MTSLFTIEIKIAPIVPIIEDMVTTLVIGQGLLPCEQGGTSVEH